MNNDEKNEKGEQSITAVSEKVKKPRSQKQIEWSRKLGQRSRELKKAKIKNNVVDSGKLNTMKETTDVTKHDGETSGTQNVSDSG